MKKLFIILLLALGTSTVQGQEIYDYLLDKSEQVINNPESKDMELKIAQFKFTAMRYFRKNIILQEGSISSTWLDEQALALNEFVTNYLLELTKNSHATEKVRMDIVMILYGMILMQCFTHTLWAHLSARVMTSLLCSRPVTAMAVAMR